MVQLCAPALIYIAFSLTQVVIDTFKGLYNTAFFKFIVMIIITFLLNALCQSGMSIISWIIVFIPFIFMSKPLQSTSTSLTRLYLGASCFLAGAAMMVGIPDRGPFANPDQAVIW